MEEGAEKCAFRDFRREEETSEKQEKKGKQQSASHVQYKDEASKAEI
jgi:hypothetical protein